MGGQAGVVQLFDCGSRACCKFTLHSAAVRAVRWSADKLHLASASDDATVRIWDISSGNCVRRHDGHTDYVRALERSPASGETWRARRRSHGEAVGRARRATGGDDFESRFSRGRHRVVSERKFTRVRGRRRHLRVGRPRRRQVAAKDAQSSKDHHNGARARRRGPPSFASGYEMTGDATIDSKSPRMITGSLDGFVKIHELDTFTADALHQVSWSRLVVLALAGL